MLSLALDFVAVLDIALEPIEGGAEELGRECSGTIGVLGDHVQQEVRRPLVCTTTSASAIEWV